MVCGRTWVMLGVAADCCVAVCCRLDPQPTQKRKKEKLALVATVFNNLPKIHPKKNQACQPKNVAVVTEKVELPGYWVERYREKVTTTVARMGYYSYPNEELRMTLPCERCRILSTADTTAPTR
jgi:hypothetical protein